jgi:hypothetical protein
MALLKEIEGETGAVAEYWRVIEVNLNYFAGVGAVALAGYIDKAKRDAGKRPIDAKQFPIQGADFFLFSVGELDKDKVNPVAVAYKFIKEYVPKEGQPANPFADAVDDL